MTRYCRSITYVIAAVQLVTWCAYLFFIQNVPTKRSPVKAVPELKNTTIYSAYNRWDALTFLDGQMYGFPLSRKHACTVKSISPVLRKNVQLRKYAFNGSTYFAYTNSTDVLEKLCLFKNGHSVLDGSYKKRESKILINLPNLCVTKNGNDMDLLILIKSAINHRKRRRTIRKFWANRRCWDKYTVRHAFLLGKPIESSPLYSVEDESRKYKDILQRDFIDKYENNTLKVLFGLQWTLSFCVNTRWLLIVDDDMFLNPKNLLSLLNSFSDWHHLGSLYGNELVFPTVVREESKWKISEESYGDSHYPNYVSGAIVLIGRELLLDLYIASRFTRAIPFDDAYLGLVLDKLLTIPVHLDLFYVGQSVNLPSEQIEAQIAMHDVRSVYRHKRLWFITNAFDICTASEDSD